MGLHQSELQNLVLSITLSVVRIVLPVSILTFSKISPKVKNSLVFEGGTWICYDLHEFDSEEPEIVEIPQVL